MTSFGPFPAPPGQQLAQANAALQAGDLQRAASLYAAHLAANPGDARAQHAQGQVLCRLGRHDHAIGHLRKAAELEPENTQYLLWLAGILDRTRQYRASLEVYNRIRALTPHNPEPHADAAALHEMLGEHDEARAAARAALEIDPDHQRARLFLIKVDLRDTKPDPETLGEWRDTVSSIAGSAPAHIAGLALELLVDICERQEAFPEAFEAIASINRLDREARAQLVPPPERREAYLRWTADLAQGLTPERTRRWAEELPPDAGPAPALLVGFPRSGTTMTERALGAHPRIRSIEERFTLEAVKTMLPRLVGNLAMRTKPLGEIIDSLTPEHVARLREAYWQQARAILGPVVEGEVVLDKMPLRIAELPFINRVFPDARIIVALRDPRDVCLSCFRQRFDFVNNVPMSFFLDLHDTARLYAHVMSLWLDHRDDYSFPSIVIRYENTVRDFEPRVREIIEFLGLPWDDAVLSFHESTGRQASTTPSYHAIRQKVYTKAVGRWRRYDRQLAPVLPTLEPLIDALGYAEHDAPTPPTPPTPNP